MKVEISHQLDPAEATARMKALVAYWRGKYAVQPRWTKQTVQLTGSFLGAKIEAKLVIGPNTVVFEGPDPGVVLRHQAVSYMTRKLGSYLGEEAPLATPGSDRVTA